MWFFSLLFMAASFVNQVKSCKSFMAEASASGKSWVNRVNLSSPSRHFLSMKFPALRLTFQRLMDLKNHFATILGFFLSRIFLNLFACCSVVSSVTDKHARTGSVSTMTTTNRTSDEDILKRRKFVNFSFKAWVLSFIEEMFLWRMFWCQISSPLCRSRSAENHNFLPTLSSSLVTFGGLESTS